MCLRPSDHRYEFQSQGVVDMLEKLHDKFEDERTDLEKEESNARHAYEMLIQVLGEASCFGILVTLLEAAAILLHP